MRAPSFALFSFVLVSSFSVFCLAGNPFAKAIENKNIEEVDDLISQGFDINDLPNGLSTALDDAISAYGEEDEFVLKLRERQALRYIEILPPNVVSASDLSGDDEDLFTEGDLIASLPRRTLVLTGSGGSESPTATCVTSRSPSPKHFVFGVVKPAEFCNAARENDDLLITVPLAQDTGFLLEEDTEGYLDEFFVQVKAENPTEVESALLKSEFTGANVRADNRWNRTYRFKDFFRTVSCPQEEALRIIKHYLIRASCKICGV